VAAALASLGVERVDVSAIPMPPPSNDGTHGSPAPVTLELLRGFALRPSVAGTDLRETVTPTAAAILSALGRPVPEMPELVLERVGVGAGARDPTSIANVVRVLLGTTSPSADGARRLLVLEANVDDLEPELVPDAIDALLAAGALDAWTAPIVMKRGGPPSRSRPCANATRWTRCGGRSSRRRRRSGFACTTSRGPSSIVGSSRSIWPRAVRGSA
jgi:uncharacterized protein (DUF111 family)